MGRLITLFVIYLFAWGLVVVLILGLVQLIHNSGGIRVYSSPTMHCILIGDSLLDCKEPAHVD